MKAIIFDLDGTLVDTVYAHVIAWQRAFTKVGIAIDGWKIHRRIGMSGGLSTRAAARELNRDISNEEEQAIQTRHGKYFREILPEPRPFPGAIELLRYLRTSQIIHGIATSGRRPEINKSLEALEIPPETIVIDRGNVNRAKPEPDLFIACQEQIGVSAEECYIVGDAVWDLLAARRARMLGIGLLSGGYGEDELSKSGAFRIFRDVLDLAKSLNELGLIP